MLHVDPWTKAAECDRAIQLVADPERRIVLESLRNLWIALSNEGSTLHHYPDTFGIDGGLPGGDALKSCFCRSCNPTLGSFAVACQPLVGRADDAVSTSEPGVPPVAPIIVR
jgi:hypothetical protein